MALAVHVLSGAYHDSVKLMRISAAASEKAHVRGAAALMGTPMNLEQLAASGLLAEEAKGAGPNDLVLVVDADAPEAAQEELTMMEAALTAPRRGGGAGPLADLSASTLDAALGVDPAINLALFSIPGPSVRREAERALRKGLHCLIFSDNVPVEDEVALKQMGREKDLLVMGPDCGTAHIGGVGLGFCNVVRPGEIGIAGAAGTGIQEAMAAIDSGGGGISCALGTGGRDVSDAVCGLATIQAVETLSEDATTKVLLVLGKPPEPAATAKVLETAAKCAKPVVIHFVGAKTEDMDRYLHAHPNLHMADSLADAGRLAISLSGGQAEATPFEVGMGARARIAEWSRTRPKSCRYLRGVYTGGTLCAEAQAIVGKTIEGIRSNAPLDKINGKMADPMSSEGHAVVDLGDDLFTRGKPHPMIDPAPRSARIVQEARDPETAVVLFDVVLGLGAHDDPAGEAARAIEEASSSGVLFIASVTGTEGDPQGLNVQRAKLAEAGALVADTHAEACLAAAAALEGLGG
ncbi:MAG: acyl-CoA synthetase FdrA [Nitrospinae bacterium]|nr:acyl-CoA synthetase FdrA [Nitrospinota bacterium]